MSCSSRAVFVGLLLASLVLGSFGIASAREQIPAETRMFGYDGFTNACDADTVLYHIQSRFRSTERDFWNSDAEITAFESVRQVALRPDGIDLIPRRSCSAIAVMSDNKRLPVHYTIIEDAGPTGIGEAVQFCLDGYDRTFTARPGCKRVNY